MIELGELSKQSELKCRHGGTQNKNQLWIHNHKTKQR